MIELSQGQALAVDQLLDIAKRSDGALEIVGEPYQAKGDAAAWQQISIETRKYRHDGGIGVDPLRWTR